ncbi:MAG: winged helix-turn-helix transcriptional regulator [Alphaproteobacteria bacterium]|nr:winged helix-turn-helix transcriptional regulator [Alphaproteobacteria bacterium]
MLHLFQKIDPEFPLQYAISLAVISQNEGMSLTSLSEKTGLALSTISRIVGALSDYRANGNPYGLVEIRLSPQERRKKELYLTEKGWKLINSIEALL